MIYLASPYSHPDPQVRAERYHLVNAYLSERFRVGELGIYSPIVHWHACSCNFNLPTDAEAWWSQNRYMLRISNELRILMIDGWKESIGVNQEWAEAQHLGIPVTRARIPVEFARG